MTSPLHPNLGRLAAAYDQIVEDHRCNKISSREARGLIATLICRDDTGLLWAINPDSGKWSFRNLRGDLVEAEPPRYGIASAKPSDLDDRTKNDFDDRLTFFEVDPTHFSLPFADGTKHTSRLSDPSVRESMHEVFKGIGDFNSLIKTKITFFAKTIRKVIRNALPL